MTFTQLAEAGSFLFFIFIFINKIEHVTNNNKNNKKVELNVSRQTISKALRENKIYR